MRLIGTTSSPFVRKVRVIALEKRLPLEFVIDSPLSPSSTVPSFNPLGKVPVLVRDDDTVLFDSPLIVEFLDSLSESPQFLPRAAADRMAVRQWEAVADGVLDAAVLVRMEMLRPEAERSSSWMHRQRQKMDSGLQFMNRTLEGRQFYLGNTFTLADVALACCLGYLDFRFPELGWRERFSGLDRVVQYCSVRQSFTETPMLG